MPASSEQFRNALRHFPSGVTIVAIKSGDIIHGLTVSAFASVSPNPPLIMVAIDHRHKAYQLLEQAGATFSVNILHQEQEALSNQFAWGDVETRFEMGEWGVAETGAPILQEAIAWLDCTIENRYVAGTHSIYIGLVQAISTIHPDAPPLIYWNREYRQLQL